MMNPIPTIVHPNTPSPTPSAILALVPGQIQSSSSVEKTCENKARSDIGAATGTIGGVGGVEGGGGGGTLALMASVPGTVVVATAVVSASVVVVAAYVVTLIVPLPKLVLD